MRLVTTAALPVFALLHIHIHIHIRLHHLLRHRFHGSPFDYLGLALGSAASWIGLPGPGEPLLIAAGVLAAHHKLDIASVIFVAAVAAMLGGIAGWLIGLAVGRQLMIAPGPLRRLRLRILERGEEVFARHPVIAIILTPAPVAGVHKVRTSTFLLVNNTTAVVWALGFGLGGYFLGPPVIDAVSDLGAVSAVGIGVLIAMGIVFEVRRRRARRP